MKFPVEIGLVIILRVIFPAHTLDGKQGVICQGSCQCPVKGSPQDHIIPVHILLEVHPGNLAFPDAAHAYQEHLVLHTIQALGHLLQFPSAAYEAVVRIDHGADEAVGLLLLCVFFRGRGGNIQEGSTAFAGAHGFLSQKGRHPSGQFLDPDLFRRQDAVHDVDTAQIIIDVIAQVAAIDPEGKQDNIFVFLKPVEGAVDFIEHMGRGIGPLIQYQQEDPAAPDGFHDGLGIIGAYIPGSIPAGDAPAFQHGDDLLYSLCPCLGVITDEDFWVFHSDTSLSVCWTFRQILSFHGFASWNITVP